MLPMWAWAGPAARLLQVHAWGALQAGEKV